MPSLISISLQCPPSKNGSCGLGIIAEEYARNNVDLLVTASNNPVAPVHEQAARIRRAHSSQKMRRGVTGRAPTDAIATFLNSKVLKFSASGCLNRFLLELGELTKGGVSTVGSSPVTFKKNFSIAKNSKTCPATSTTPALTGTFDMNVDIDINARVSYGFAVAGKIVPPTIGNVGFSTYALFLLRCTLILTGFCPVKSVEMHPPFSTLRQPPRLRSKLNALRSPVSPCHH